MARLTRSMAKKKKERKKTTSNATPTITIRLSDLNVSSKKQEKKRSK